MNPIRVMLCVLALSGLVPGAYAEQPPDSGRLPPITFTQQSGFYTHSGKVFDFNGVIVVRGEPSPELQTVGILWDHEDEDFIHYLDRGVSPTSQAGIFLLHGRFSGNPDSEKLRLFIKLESGEKALFRLHVLH